MPNHITTTKIILPVFLLLTTTLLTHAAPTPQSFAQMAATQPNPAVSDPEYFFGNSDPPCTPELMAAETACIPSLAQQAEAKAQAEQQQPQPSQDQTEQQQGQDQGQKKKNRRAPRPQESSSDSNGAGQDGSSANSDSSDSSTSDVSSSNVPWSSDSAPQYDTNGYPLCNDQLMAAGEICVPQPQ